MHTDEQGFLAAIADRPADDAIRLIYADWLDEHDATAQATFLRQECMWLATHPFTGPPARPEASTLLKDVSQTAMTLDDGWLMQVSRTRWEMHRLLWRFLAAVMPTPPYDHRYGIVTTPDARWIETVRQARIEVTKSLLKYVSPKDLAKRCVIPIDHWFFLTLVRTGLQPPQHRGQRMSFRGMTNPWAHAALDGDVREEMPADAPPLRPPWYGMWLRVAPTGFGDRLAVQVCIDTGVPHWGQVLEIDPMHPSLGRAYHGWPDENRIPQEPAFTYPTFSSCFADQVRMAEGEAER